jgi:hypothetical protein
MEYKFSDSKIFTEKEKKYYIASNGDKLDFTWKPSIIDKLYKEYVEVQMKVFEGYKSYVAMIESAKKASNVTDADKQAIYDYSELIDQYKIKSHSIIIASLRANNIQKEESYLENLLSEEKDIMIRLIMDIPSDFDIKKK